jgi:ubiquitin carboxyl-terminal hydrolase 9/24
MTMVGIAHDLLLRSLYDNFCLLVSSSSSAFPEDRLRYWNGYLLFYERIDDARTPVSAKKSKVTRIRPSQELNLWVLAAL